MVSLQAFVLAAALIGAGETVLLDFSADWCGPCRMMEPTIQRLRDAGYPVQKVDVDQQPDLARRFSVQPIPCFVLVVNGQETERVVGAASYDRLSRMFLKAGYEPRGQARPKVRAQSPDPPVGLAPLAALPRIAPPPQRQRAAPAGRQSSGTQPPTTSVASSAQQRALRATVRLKVIDSKGHSFGTGTIIDTHGDEALILTCGHIFRESNGKGQILVDLFVPGVQGPVPGQLIEYEADQRDIGLVSIRPGISIQPAPVASTTVHPRPEDAVFSVGCDHGSPPTVRTSTISAVDRYTGPPNLEVYGHPVEGRSGGGLFTADGQLIGICNAADLQEDRGIYASLPTIQLKLKQMGVEHIYLRGQAPLMAKSSTAAPPTALAPVPSAESRNAIPAPAPAPAGEEMEVICIVRSKSNPRGQNRVLVLERPSAELLERLAREAQRNVAPDNRLGNMAQLPPVERRQSPPNYSNGPIVRAQNR